MRKLLIGLLPCLGFLLGSSIARAQSDPASEVIRLVNELRASYGVPAYEVDAILMSVAQAQASWSAENNHIGHDGPGGSTPDDRAQAAGYGGGARSFAIENTGHGTVGINTPQLVVTMWQTDWGHLNAMISPDYEHIGVGYAEAGGYSWFVMMVGWVDGPANSGDSQAQGAGEESAPYVPFILSEPDESGAIYHEVQPGQSAWTVAAHYEVDLAELLSLNDLTEDSILHPGDVLLVRAAATPTSTPLPEPPTQTPSATPPPVPSAPTSTPTPTQTVVAEPPQQSWMSKYSPIIGLAIVLVTGIAVVRARMGRGAS